MIARSANTLMSKLKPNGLAALVAALGVGFIVTVLLPGLKMSGDLVSGNTALESVGEEERYPTAIRAALDSLHDRLMSRSYIQEALDQLRDTAAKLDTASNAFPGPHAAALRAAWQHERDALTPLLSYSGVPYDDSEASGTVLNERGRLLEHDVSAAIRVSRHALPVLDNHLQAAAADLQSDNAGAAKKLRLFMLIGLGIAAALVALVAVQLSLRQRQNRDLRQARQQTLDILRTVREGLFLLDEKLKIGTAHSAALETLFQRTDIAGLDFEQLLRHVVSQKTLATALKYVKVLWTERTNEKLVKSINPLGEVEVHLDTGGGRFETRYLQFDFHRVRDESRITHVLVSVSDVSARVELARELAASRTQSQAQVDTLLGILHIDPTQLSSFLGDTNAAMKMINAVLREPARDEGMFRKKLDTLFRQAHSVKGEAAALGLSSIESRAHSFEDDLKVLREKHDLSGNDFLPLVIKLDDLLTHLQSVGELVARLSRPQPVLSAADHEHISTDVITGSAGIAGTPASGTVEPRETLGAGFVNTLGQLAARIAHDYGKKVTLQWNGFEGVPEGYRRIVKDITIQAIRNAMIHGIESPELRVAAGKSEQGQVRLTFEADGECGYKMCIEDDGQGLATERIKEVALRKGLFSTEQAASMDVKQLHSLLFTPGFSTVENATKDAGRGVGMNLIADLAQTAGGKVGIASARGRFTRLTVNIPAHPKVTDETVAA